jgi:site-specific recombinase XerD
MDQFKSYLEEKEYSVNTIKQYTTNMKKYFDSYGDPTDNTQKEIIENIENIKLYDTRNKKEVPSINGRTQLIKSVISFLKYKNKPTDKISRIIYRY